MTMPRQGYPPRIYEYTPGDLSGLSVDGMGPGQMAWVLSNKFTYVLQPAVGVADGSNILDTLDDVSLQWVFINYGEPTSFPGYGGAPPSVDSASAAGTAATASRSDHTHLGVKSVAIADANGGIQIVTGNNKDFTFQYVPISVANIAALTAIPVLHLVSGQLAYVASVRQMFVLEAATAGAANGVNVVATVDDASRQWMYPNLFDGALYTYFGPEIEMAAAPASYDIVPAISGKVFIPIRVTTITTAVAGAITGASTVTVENPTQAANILGPVQLQSAALFAVGVNALSGSTPSTGVQSGKPLVSGAKVQMTVTIAATGTGGFSFKTKPQVEGFYL